MPAGKMRLAKETKETRQLRLAYKKFKADIDPEKLSLHFSRLKDPAIFGANGSSKYSYFLYEPIDRIFIGHREDEPFSKLQEKLGKFKIKERYKFIPEDIFFGGWAGFFGYELGKFIEPYRQTVVHDIPLPLAELKFYDKVICIDRENKEVWFFGMGRDKREAEGKIAELEDEAAKALNEIKFTFHPFDIESVKPEELKSNFRKENYIQAIKKIRRYIKDGEVYQINFSQRFESEFDRQDSIKLFLWQNKFNPSPYSAYLSSRKYDIVSASPELFMSVKGDIISTKPIKGTRPRVLNTENMKINKQHIEDLKSCEKEKAELNMIIDLERNDLGKICKAGTIKVVHPRTVEEYPTVYHAVSTVEGKLKEDVCFCDCLEAMFPGGSITGAPKPAAMKYIDELEPTGRNVYTGSIGLLGIDGKVCLNIAIRTIIISKNKAYAQTGGGIVYDSKPQAEYEETLTKARALAAGIEAVKKTKG